MKRSEINQIIRSADQFIRAQGLYLPPFAYWTPEEWRKKGPEAREIVEYNLGWDITDYGLGDFANTGLFLFTVRNGPPLGTPVPAGKMAKPYAEKLLISDVNQVTPMHFHWNKMEDIINRGGGELVIELYNAGPADELADTPIEVSLDGVAYTLAAGTILRLQPGESISLTPRLYHRFWAEGGKLLIGEVSVVNDDNNDNRFYETLGRFPTIEEDEPPLYLLTIDYAQYYGGGNG